MAQTIYLRIGEKDRVPLRMFIDSLTYFLKMLRDFDATVSENIKGSVVWEVVSLKQSSPPIVGVRPAPKHGMFDNSDAVEKQLLLSTTELTVKGERTRLMSDAALINLERLAQKTKRLGEHSIFLNGDGTPKQQATITEKTLEHAQEFTSPKYKNYGSIVGKLEAISVHSGNEFRVWDEKTGKPVRCKFDTSQEDSVKSLLRQRVIVTGEILSNSGGMPISLGLRELSSVGEHSLPTIDQMRGLVTDFTEGKSLREYLEEIADE